MGELLFCMGYFRAGALFFVVYSLIVGKLLLALLVFCFAFFNS
jgi:hypothetical protein